MYRPWIVCAFACLVVPSISAGELPRSLAVIPGDAAGFVAVDVPGVLNSPLCDELRFALGGLKPAELAAFAKKFPVDPTTVERAVIVLPNAQAVMEPMAASHPTAVSALVIIGCSKPFDPAVLVKSFYPGGRAKSYRDRVYHFYDDTWTGLLVLPDNRTFVFGTEDSLVWLIDRLAKGESAGALSSARVEAAGRTIYAAVNPAAALPPGFAVPPAFQGLAAAQRICIAIDLGKALNASLTLHYADAAGATAGVTAVKAALELGRGKLKELDADLKKIIDRPTAAGQHVSPTEFPERFAALLGLGMLRRVDEILGALPVERQGTTVRVAAEINLPMNGGSLLLVGVAAVTTLGTNANSTFQFVGDSIVPPGGGPAAPSPQEVRLKKLGAAFEAYHTEHGCYPPAATYAKDGTPLHSWRVALLPYLGEKKLHDEFRLDEPWDSLHNKKLIARMPAAFNKPYAHPMNRGRTNAQVVTGAGTQFDGPSGRVKPARGAIVLAVESEDGVPVWWTKPADRFAAPGKVPQLFGTYNHSCWALFTDGSVRRLNRTADEKQLPGLIARPAGQ